VRRNLELIYGGAAIGLMGKLADSVLEAGGCVTGIIPESFSPLVSHRGLTRLHVVGSMHERKQMMFDISDAFIALPGGLGTLEELAELLTWAQIGIHSKPCGLLNVSGYYDALLRFMDHAVSQEFIKPRHRRMIQTDQDPAVLMSKIEAYVPPEGDKWTDIETKSRR
jgi:hypothetical protein